MSEPPPGTGGEVPIDARKLLDALSGKRLAGVEIAEPLRSNLLRAVSKLAAQGPLNAAVIERWFTPLLIGLSKDAASFPRYLRAELLRCLSTPDVPELAGPGGGANSQKRGRRLAMAAMALTLFIGTAASFWFHPWAVDRPPEKNAAAPAETVVSATSLQAPSISDRRTLDAGTIDALLSVASAGAPTAEEAAQAAPSLTWLPAAIAHTGWPASTPMPLADTGFVRAMLAIPAGEAGAAGHPRAEAAERIAGRARQTEAGRAWTQLRELRRNGPYPGVEGGQMEGRHWYVQELAAATRTANPDAFVVAGDEPIARAWAGLRPQNPLAIVDAPWSPTASETRIDGEEPSNSWKFLVGIMLALVVAGLAGTLAGMPITLRETARGSSKFRFALRRPAMDDRQSRARLREWRLAVSTAEVEATELDLERSIIATAAEAGFFVRRYRSRAHVPDLNVAIERWSLRDCLADWWLRLCRDLIRLGAPLRVRVYRGSMGRQGLRTDLAGDDAGPPRGDSLRVGSASSLQWLGETYPRMRASPPAPPESGLQTRQAAIMDLLPEADEFAERFFHGADRNWTDEAPLGHEEWLELQGALLMHLGRAGYRWLAGCAALPIIDAATAWTIASALDLDSDDAFRRTAPRLFSLPWLRQGRLPEWLRLRLIDSLPAADAATLAELLANSLERRTESDPASLIAGHSGAIDGAGDATLARFMFSDGEHSRLSVKNIPDRFLDDLLPRWHERLLSRHFRARLAVVAVGAMSLAGLLLWLDLSQTNLSYALAGAGLAALFALAAATLAPARRALAGLRTVILEEWGRRDAMLRFDEGRRTRPSSRRALQIAIFCFAAGTGLLALRLVSVAMDPNAALESSIGGSPSTRGEIRDRNGVVFARTVRTWSLAVRPRLVRGDRVAIAARLAALLPGRSREELERLLSSRAMFTYVAHRISTEMQAEVRAIGDPGVVVTRESARIYPQGAAAAQVLGVTDPDGRGLSGLEAAMNDRLRTGDPITLSIDAQVQEALETELANASQRLAASGGAGIVLNARTGEIVAMASVPSLNPNVRATVTPEATRNNAVVSVYEMGGVFRPITVASAREAGVIAGPETLVDTSPLAVGRFFIRDSLAGLPPRMSVAGANVWSSAVAAARLADAVGAERQQNFLRQLGFSDRVALEIGGTARPLWPRSWERLTVMTTGYGHGIAITPLHLAAAYAALVNGGEMVRPTLLTSAAAAPRRVMARDTSDMVRQLLRLNVVAGSSRRADVSGLRVGGATGTTDTLAAGGNRTGAAHGVFVGAFPMDAPVYIVLIDLDGLRNADGGSSEGTAPLSVAPVAAAVIDRVAGLLGVRRESERELDLGQLRALAEARR